MAEQAKIEWEAANLRYRVAVLDFAGAASSAQVYTRLVAAAARRLPPDQARAALHSAGELLDWARHALAAARERLAADLGRLGSIARYQPAARALTRTWKIEA